MEVCTQNFPLICISTGRSSAALGQGVERKQPLSPPLHSWHLTGLGLASHQGRTCGAPPWRGGLWGSASRGSRGSRGSGGQREQGLASEPKRAQASREKSTPLIHPALPLVLLQFCRIHRHLVLGGEPAHSQSYSWLPWLWWNKYIKQASGVPIMTLMFAYAYITYTEINQKLSGLASGEGNWRT